jgi:hypothetical protein
MSGEARIVRNCPACGKTLKIPLEFVGHKVKCLHCQHLFVVQPAAAGGARLDQADDSPLPADEGSPPSPAAAASPSASGAVPVVGPGASGLLSTQAPGASGLGLSSHSTAGPYMVAKVFMAGRMVHSTLEEALNKHAQEGWELVQAVLKDQDLFLIFRRAS